MADLENSSELLRQSLDELRKTGMLTAATLDKLNKASAKAANGTADLGDASKEAAVNVNTFDKKLVSAVKSLTDAGNAIRDNREDFRSLNPAIRASGIALGAAGRKIGGVVEGVGDAVSGLSLLLGPKGKLIGMIGGGLISGFGKAIGASSDAAAQLAVQFGEFATGELQKVVEAYRQVGAVGGIAAGGMDALYDQAIAAGLSIGQFAKVIATNSETLARSTGSTAEGAKVLSQMAQVGDATTRQFLALGISFEQQRDFQAKFLEQNRLTGRIQRGDTQALTEASKAYIFQLDELSRITGLSREQAAKLLQEQMNNVRFRASLRIAEREFGKDTKTAMEQAVAIVGAQSKEFGTGFADLMGPGGASTQAAMNLQIATGNAAKGIADMVRTGQMSADQGAAALQKAIQDKLAGLSVAGDGGDAYLAIVGGVEGPMKDLLLSMDNVARAQNMNVASLTATRKEAEEAKNAQGKNTKEIIEAQLALQKFAIGLDKLVKEKVLPHAASAVKLFTQTLLGSIDYINQKLGITSGGASGGGGTASSGGARSAASPAFAGAGARPGGTSEDYLSRIAKLESGGRNIGNVPRAGQQATSAFGLYQITKKTFEGLAANAPPSSALKGKTFEDMKSDVNLQTEAMKQLTSSNEQLLARRGLSTSDAAKYMAHMMGYGTASRILEAPGDTPLGRLVPQEYLDKNNLAMYRNAGQLREHFDRITGGGGYQYGGIASGPKSGYAAMLHGTEAVVPLAGGRSIPVEMTGMSDKIGEQVGMMSAQLDRLDEMVSLMRTSNDTNAKILRASQN